MDTWIEPFLKKGLLQGQELLFRWEVAVDFIEECARNECVILGIDFYKETPSDIVELIGCSADFSSVKYSSNPVTKSTSAARSLILDGYPDGADWASFVF